MNPESAEIDDRADDRSEIAFLRALGAARIPHSGRTLEAHLTGTYRVLCDWGCPRDVCLAGLCHSVYGTPAFGHRLTSDRDAVRRCIGVAAEALVYEYSRLQHGKFIESLADDAEVAPNVRSGRALPSVEVRRALAHLVVANELELACRSELDAATRRRIGARISRHQSVLAPFLSDAALASLRAAARVPADERSTVAAERDASRQ